MAGSVELRLDRSGSLRQDELNIGDYGDQAGGVEEAHRFAVYRDWVPGHFIGQNDIAGFAIWQDAQESALFGWIDLATAQGDDFEFGAELVAGDWGQIKASVGELGIGEWFGQDAVAQWSEVH